jgi:hypothetical protein
LFSCQNNSSTPPAATASGDSAFKELAWSPEASVALGFHQYDGKLTDYSRASLDQELSRLKAFDQQLGKLDTSTLSPAMFYDYRILRAGVRNDIFNFEDKESYTKNPMTYAGAIDVNIYVKRNFAPLEDRVRSIINIENCSPAVFAAAKKQPGRFIRQTSYRNSHRSSKRIRFLPGQRPGSSPQNIDQRFPENRLYSCQQDRDRPDQRLYRLLKKGQAPQSNK